VTEVNEGERGDTKQFTFDFFDDREWAPKIYGQRKNVRALRTKTCPRQSVSSAIHHRGRRAHHH
jgi:hypothetical protein